MVEDSLFIDNDRPDVAEKFWRLENQDSIGLHADTGEPWYSPFHSNKEDSHWNKYKKNLQKKNWPENSIKILDEYSGRIVSRLANPNAAVATTKKGLVIGHIQSGKTANIMAVVAKAVDAGYKAVIIMAGSKELLRQQTQDRMNRELGIASLSNPLDPATDYNNNSGWARWSSYNNDIVNHGTPGIGDDALIVITKKNVNGDGGTLPTLLRNIQAHRNIPTLIIDDECDEATPNGMPNGLQPVHAAVRRLIEAHNKVSYVGYSATPFANVLINRGSTKDLYPRDFIIPLPKPEGYIGSDDIFGSSLIKTDEELNEEFKPTLGLDIIRELSSDEIQLICANRSEKKWNDLKFALKYYILAATVRRLKTRNMTHTSMLINVDVAIQVQRNISTRVADLLKSVNPAQYPDNPGMNTIYKTAWCDLQKTASKHVEVENLEFSYIMKEIPKTIELIRVKVENADAAAAERLNFSEIHKEGDAKHYIVIGGNMVSRGVTLEGLLVSYFGRNSKNYATLTQMGRWLGFRSKYIDLCRIWMSNENKYAYRQLALVEQEIREDISLLEKKNVTPMEFPPRIRIIEGYQIARPALMQNVKETFRHFFAGQAIETTKFYDDQHQPTPQSLEQNQQDTFYSKPDNAISENWKACQDLVEGILGGNCRPETAADGSSILFKNIDVKLIIRFLEAYHIHPKQVALYDEPDVNHLINYLEEYKNDHKKWNVVIRSVPTNKSALLPFKSKYNLPEIGFSYRSREKNHRTHIEIDRLMNGSHVLLDMPKAYKNQKEDRTIKEMLERRNEENNNQSLLVLYPIHKDSPAPTTASDREALKQKSHILGFGMVFSGEQRTTERFVAAGNGKKAKKVEE